MAETRRKAGHSRRSRGPDGVAVEEVYGTIRRHILRYDVLPGQRLDTRQLAAQHGVSTTLIRDAFNRLTAEALVVHVPSRGYFVRPIDAAEMIETYELIFVLIQFGIEKDLAAFSTDGLRPGPLLTSDESGLPANVTAALAQQYGAFVEALFDRIVSLSGNGLAIRALRAYMDQTHYVREHDLRDPHYLGAVDNDLKSLQVALAAGNQAAAIGFARSMLERKIRRLPELVRQIRIENLGSALPMSDPATDE